MGSKEHIPVVSVYTGYFPKEVEGEYVPRGVRRKKKNEKKKGERNYSLLHFTPSSTHLLPLILAGTAIATQTHTLSTTPVSTSSAFRRRPLTQTTSPRRLRPSPTEHVTTFTSVTRYNPPHLRRTTTARTHHRHYAIFTGQPPPCISYPLAQPNQHHRNHFDLTFTPPSPIPHFRHHQFQIRHCDLRQYRRHVFGLAVFPFRAWLCSHCRMTFVCLVAFRACVRAMLWLEMQSILLYKL
ncbi:uncharacterized protein LOC127102402 [Lathyrus oleraceus]|uniref:uncharacterized protein LOC127102402 n=1 Tax=Pisum sativum TaxID=3888 RepID=UPI0021D23554|nr:uncharacterized protein LOC127102402 [Pisum sativum]